MTTIEKLKSMTDDDLFAHFQRHARYVPDGPRDGRYYIRPQPTGRAIFSDDTHTLREKFFEFVRAGKEDRK